MNRFTCDWIFHILVVLCDGKVVCGCADPEGRRPLGHLAQNTLPEIWQSTLAREIRRGLNEGFSPFCLDCGLKTPLAEGVAPPQRQAPEESPARIFFEPTVLCNLSCYQAVCSRETGLVHTRGRTLFPFDEFKAMLAPVGDRLVRLDFFNYGDPFVHPQALEMIEHIKRTYPRLFLYISTNGLLLDDEKIRRLVAAAPDELTFSVDGSDAAAYSRYRRGGDFDRVLEIMKKTVAERRRNGQATPFINWRYILFRWNDSRWQMRRARRLADAVGVDRLTWEITDHPADAWSRTYVPGSRAWRRIRNEIWDTSQLAEARRGRRYRARIRPSASAYRAVPGQALRVTVRVKNTGGANWPSATPDGRRLVRLGAQLYDAERRLLELNHARAFLPHPVPGGGKAEVTIELPPLSEVGEYWLRFDMVSEGIAWFDSTGSPVVWRRLRVG